MTITRREFIEAVGGLAAITSVSLLVADDDLPPAGRMHLISADKVLLVDHEFVAKAENVRLKLHPPRKTGE